MKMKAIKHLKSTHSQGGEIEQNSRFLTSLGYIVIEAQNTYPEICFVGLV